MSDGLPMGFCARCHRFLPLWDGVNCEMHAQGTPTRQSRDAKQGSVGVADGGPVAESDAPK